MTLVLHTDTPAAISWANRSIEASRRSAERTASVVSSISELTGRSDLEIVFYLIFPMGLSYDKALGIPAGFRAKSEVHHLDGCSDVITPKQNSTVGKNMHWDLYGLTPFALWKEVDQTGIRPTVFGDGNTMTHGALEITLDGPGGSATGVYSIWDSQLAAADVIADTEAAAIHGWHQVPVEVWEADASAKFRDPDSTLPPGPR